MNNQKGFFKLISFAFVFLLVSLGLIIYLTSSRTSSSKNTVNDTVEFAELSDDTEVPVVIDNSAIDELDALIKEIDSTEESLSDLDL